MVERFVVPELALGLKSWSLNYIIIEIRESVTGLVLQPLEKALRSAVT